MSANAYLDSLVGDPGPSTTAYRAWESVLAGWDGQLDDSVPFPEQTPWPTLHSVLNSDKAVNDVAEKVSTVRIVEPEPEHEEPDLNTSALLARLHRHLQPGAYISLMDLLASPRDDMDIQSELVETLGFEGEGLSLVEELLRPGVRQALVAGSKGGKKKGATPSASGHATPRKRKGKIDITDVIGTAEDIERRIQEQLNRPKAMFVEESQQRSLQQAEKLPNVFTSSSTMPALSYGGKIALPQGTEREQTDSFEEVTVPPPTMVPPKMGEKPVMINSLSPLAQRCFPKYVSLNRMQSVVHPTAMGTNENMLVCAPTGAGKTDVALMSILRVLESHLLPGPGFKIDKDKFKIIYVAPMKALAAEITRKFGKRLQWLGIHVRELTGDMQLTRQEINDTQIIVTTPEKWDVVTRKPTGEGELASKVRLLIIDEVHLLNEERGAVIETIVARTLRQVESSQSLIRIVGLSATLPNYIDVSDFLRVNRYQGLFFFDASFRPVPLEQHFIGVKGKARSQTQIRNMDNVVFDKVLEMVKEGHQVMVFVHARKETVKTAQKLKEMATEEGALDVFDTRDHPKFQLYRRDVGTSRNKEMKELFDYGFGIHHAGMLRSDRNMMERMFEDNAIKVLCCTSTLAWGVNLPAHAVIIKGTQVYDSNKGSFQDLSVLDVLQIFGRAGRPGYETSGVGYICTTQDKLDHYLYSIMSQQPIESKFIPGMVDALNAEISLGTIANVREAISWIGYTYLFVRMRREPFIYGMSHDEPKDDPQLGNKRSDLVTQAARQLAAAKMATFDESNNSFAITDLGRIAARYYLRHQTVEVFNEKFNPRMKNADIFAMLSQATEFAQIQIRDNEVDELTNIMNSDNCPMEVNGGATSAQGKVNILLQAYISKVYIEDFALVSDSAYVAQNAGRIIRALLEIALSRNWANCALLLIDLSKAIEKRMWPYDHPLGQLNTLQRDTLYNLRRWADDTEIQELREMEPKELGELVHLNPIHGAALRNAALMFPTIGVSYALRPLAHDLLQISVTVEPQFTWNTKVSGSSEPFYVWVQDEEGLHILQWRSILLRQTSTAIDIDFVIPWSGEHQSLSIVTASDRWLGSDSQTPVSLVNLVMPAAFDERTPPLDLPFLSISAVDDPDIEKQYRPYITMFNTLQSQSFWSVYHTQNNILISAPVASGKSLMGEMAMWHALRHQSDAFILAIVPGNRSSAEAAARLRHVLGKRAKVVLARNSKEFEVGADESGARVLVATPGAFDDIVGEKLTSLATRLSLIVLEDLHLLDASYELSVIKLLTLAKPACTRIVGLTCSLSNPSDLASWLGVEYNYRYCFTPQDRSSPLVVSTRVFNLPHGLGLLKSMIKPTYDLIKSTGSAIVFTPSASSARAVAADLVTQSGTEFDLNGFLSAPRADVEPLLANLADAELLEPLLHGVGYVVPTMRARDLALVLELYAAGIVRALIAPRTQAWKLPVRAETVVLAGAQYLHFRGEERMLRNYSKHELVKMQGFAAQSASPTSPAGKMVVMCQAEQVVSIRRLLNDGLSLESALPSVLDPALAPLLPSPVSANTGRGRDTAGIEEHERQVLARMLVPRPKPRPIQPHRPRDPDLRARDLMDLLSWSYLVRRIRTNPSFYDAREGEEREVVSRWIDSFFISREERERGHTQKPKDRPKLEDVEGYGQPERKDKEHKDDEHEEKVLVPRVLAEEEYVIEDDDEDDGDSD